VPVSRSWRLRLRGLEYPSWLSRLTVLTGFGCGGDPRGDAHKYMVWLICVVGVDISEIMKCRVLVGSFSQGIEIETDMIRDEF
jgi:hypothetical protein